VKTKAGKIVRSCYYTDNAVKTKNKIYKHSTAKDIPEFAPVHDERLSLPTEINKI
jgi:hypothetical protein